MTKLKLTLWAIFLPLLLASAQELSLTKYGVEEGLPTDFTKGIIQDEKGFLWIATDDGLVRFNGIESTIISDKIPSQYIKGFKKLSDQRILVIHDMGVSQLQYENDSIQISLLMEGSSSMQNGKLNYPKGVYEDKEGYLWVSENSRIVRYDGTTLKPYTFDAGNNSDSFLHSFAFLEDGFGTLWMFSYTGNLFYYQRPEDKFVQVETGIGFTSVNEVTLKGDNTLVVGSGSGIFEIEVTPNKTVTKSERIGQVREVSCITKISDKLLYAGTWTSGLHMISFADNGNYRVEKVKEITYSTINSLYVSQNNDVWACSNQGIGLLQESFFNGIYLKDAQNYINAIAEAGGKITVADVDAFRLTQNEVGKWEDQKFFYVDRGSIMSLAGNDTHLWLGDYSSFVYIMDLKSGNSQRVQVGQDQRLISFLSADKKGNVWICKDGDEGGVYMLSPNNQLTHFTNENGLNSKVVVAKEGANGKLYCGGESASGYLFEYNESQKSFTNLSVELPFTFGESFAVSDLAGEKNGTLWLATSHGLLKYSGGKIERIELGEGLTAAPVKSVALTKDGSIWASGSYGLVRYLNGITFLYDESNGLPAKTANYRTLFVDSNDRLWVGTVKGAAVSSENRYDVTQTNPPTFLSLRFNGEKVSPQLQNPNFGNNTYVEANFLTLSYPNDKTIYQYRITGKNDLGWSNPSPRTEVTIPSLSAGNHALEVRAKQKGGFMWSAPTRFSFVILPPWYFSWWAIALYVSAFGGVAFAVVRVQTYRLKKQREYLEGIINERTEEIREKNVQLEEKNKHITDSIRYAKDIQVAVLPEKKRFKEVFSDSFVLYHPKDIVSGDFFWFTEVAGKVVVAVVDCTGHGVPGAFMSMIGNILLNEIVSLNKNTSPASILEELHVGVRNALRQDQEMNDDGMDAGICVVEYNADKQGAKVTFAGAKVPMIYMEEGQMHRVRGTNRGIGGMYDRKTDREFKENSFEFQRGTQIFISTDGYADQGNSKNERFGTLRMMELIKEISVKPMQEQKIILRERMQAFMDGAPQRDDITVFGITV